MTQTYDEEDHKIPIPKVGSTLDLVGRTGPRIQCGNCGNKPDYWKVATNSMEGQLGLYCPACGFFFTRRYRPTDEKGRYRLQFSEGIWLDHEVSSTPREPVIRPRPQVNSHLMAESDIGCNQCLKRSKIWVVRGWQWRKDLEQYGEIQLACVDCEHVKRALMRPCKTFDKDCVEIQIVDRWITFHAVRVLDDIRPLEITIGTASIDSEGNVNIPTFTDKETHMHLRISVVHVIDGFVGQVLATFQDEGKTTIVWQSDPVAEDEKNKDGKVLRTAEQIARETAVQKRDLVVKGWFK